jgi:MFS family permease
VFFVPLFGWASDKVGRRRPFIVAGSISMALTLISIAYANDVGLFFSVFALGISAAAIPPLAMRLSPKVSHRDCRALDSALLPFVRMSESLCPRLWLATSCRRHSLFC